MATQVIEYLTSDLSGEEIPVDSAGGTVEFTISGANYAVDLTAAELDGFNQALAPYVDAAQRLTNRGVQVTRSVVPSSTAVRRPKEQLAAIRHWAKKNGHSVSERGRIPEAILAAFDTAH